MYHLEANWMSTNEKTKIRIETNWKENTLFKEMQAEIEHDYVKNEIRASALESKMSSPS